MANKGGRLWTLPRPTRDLHDLESALKSFAVIAKGKKWRGNRDLQKQFEGKIPHKTEHVGDYGSGGRTWAALLRVYGLWYDDTNVTITSAGQVLISGKNVYEQIVRLILSFQIPSAYSEHQKMEDGFKIFPFCFILDLLLDDRLEYLAQEEIALFVLNVKTPSEYEQTVSEILKYRKQKDQDGRDLKERESLIKEHMSLYRPNKRTDSPKDVKGQWQYINDFANTFVNHVRFLHEVEYDRSNGKILIKNDKKKSFSEMLYQHKAKHPFSTLYKYSERRYAEHYGLQFDRSKATKKLTSPQTRGAKRFKKIKDAYIDIKKTNASLSAPKVVELLVQKTGISDEEIGEIISENPELSLVNIGNIDVAFAEYYLECGGSGVDDQIFENMTRDIFTEMGFPTKKENLKRRRKGVKPAIDGLIKNSQALKSGILECKSGEKYSFPIGDCEKMKNIYIQNFLKHCEDGNEYSLDFFMYVIGKKMTGLNNFEDILTVLPGSVIYAKDLIHIYSKFKSGQISKSAIWDLFKSKKHISWNDIEDVS